MLSATKLQLDDIASRQKTLSEELDPRRESRSLEFYVRLVPRMLDAERCSVFIHDPVTEKVWLRSGTGVAERGIEVSVKGSVVGDVIASGKSFTATGLESRNGAHRETDMNTGFSTREILCVPIRSRDGSKTTGAIEVLNKKTGSGFGKDDEAFLEEVADHFQGIIENIYLSQEAVDMTRKAVTIAHRAMVAGAVLFGMLVFTFPLVYMAVLSRLE